MFHQQLLESFPLLLAQCTSTPTSPALAPHPFLWLGIRPAPTRRPWATMSQHGAPGVETAHLVNGRESPLNLVSLVKALASAQLLEASCSLSAAQWEQPGLAGDLAGGKAPP